MDSIHHFGSSLFPGKSARDVAGEYAQARASLARVKIFAITCLVAAAFSVISCSMRLSHELGRFMVDIDTLGTVSAALLVATLLVGVFPWLRVGVLEVDLETRDYADE